MASFKHPGKPPSQRGGPRPFQAKCGACGEPIEVRVPAVMASDSLAVFALCPECQARELFETGGHFTELAADPEGARFPLGRVRMTGGAAAALADSGEGSAEFLAR